MSWTRTPAKKETARDLQRLDWAAATTPEAQEDLLERQLLACLDADGAVIVEGCISSEQCDNIVEEMQPFLDATPMGRHSLEPTSGEVSRRTGALAARSAASHACIGHPVSIGACRAVLERQGLTGHATHPYGGAPGTGGYPFQCMLTQIIDVGPGQQAQGLHRVRPCPARPPFPGPCPT